MRVPSRHFSVSTSYRSSRKLPAPTRRNTGRRIVPSAAPVMPEENDANEQRRSEEKIDYEEKKSEQHQIALMISEKEKFTRWDEQVIQRLHLVIDDTANVTAEMRQIQDDLFSLSSRIRSNLRQDIENYEVQEAEILESLWSKSPERAFLQKLDSVTSQVQSELEQQSQELTALENNRQDVTKSLKSQLKQLLEHDDHLKERGAHRRHRQICADYADGALAIAKHLTKARIQAMELEYLKCGAWHPISASSGKELSSHDATKCHSVGALLSESKELPNDSFANAFKRLSELHFEFNPAGEDTNTTSASLNHPIRALGHVIRGIEFDCTRYHIFPGLAFSRTWATLHVTEYCSSWHATNDELRSWLRLEKLRVETLSQFRYTYMNLLRDLKLFAYRVDDILRDYRDLINEGDTLLCPHQHQDYHEWHCKTFTGLQRNRYDYLHLQALVNAQIEELRAHTLRGSKKFVKARNDLFNALEESVKPQLEWRREYRRWSEKLMATLSVGYLLHGKPVASHNPGITPMTISASTKRTRQAKRTLTRWRPQAWLDHSLLPTQFNIPVDYIASSQSLYAVLPELYESKVLGIDIVKSVNGGTTLQSIEYVLLASERQIVIIDMQAIHTSQLGFAVEVLRFLLEHEHILKVGFQSHVDMMFLWKLNIINMNCYHTVSITTLDQFGDNSIPDKVCLSTLRSLRNGYPQVYFHHLACRPYAALRAFHASAERDVVRSHPHGNWFDVSSTRAELDRELQQGRADRSIGPITIDRMSKHAFGRSTGTSRPFTTKSRGLWLKMMSLRMASRLINGRKDRQNVDFPAWNSMDVESQEQCQLALAAYFMAAVFNEDLQTIVHSLEIVPSNGAQGSHQSSLERCAAWILWTAKAANLPINNADRAMLSHHLHGHAVEDYISIR